MQVGNICAYVAMCVVFDWMGGELAEKFDFSEKYFMEFMQLFDLDGDNKVTLEEYELALGIKQVGMATVKSWEEIFKQYDEDGNGNLTPSEVLKCMQSIGYKRCTLEEVNEWFKTIDKNDDKCISYEEFVSRMTMLSSES